MTHRVRCIGAAREAMRGQRRPAEAAEASGGYRGQRRPPKTTRGHLRLTEVMRGHRRPREATGDQRRPPEATLAQRHGPRNPNIDATSDIGAAGRSHLLRTPTSPDRFQLQYVTFKLCVTGTVAHRRGSFSCRREQTARKSEWLVHHPYGDCAQLAAPSLQRAQLGTLPGAVGGAAAGASLFIVVG